MAISSVSNPSLAVGAYNLQARDEVRSKSDNVQAAQPQKDAAAQAKLSASGRAKSSLEEVQTKANALQNLDNVSSRGDFTNRVQDFVQSVNRLANVVTESQTNSNAASEAEKAAARALEEIRNAFSNGNREGASVSERGVESRTGESLSLNAQSLDNALNRDPQGTVAAYTQLAERAGNAAGRELATSTAAVQPKPEDTANRPAGNAQGTQSQARFDEQKVSQMRLAAQLASADGYSNRNAVATYFSVAAL